jgi:hypothetical protein
MGGLFARTANMMPDIDAAQYRIKPDLCLLPSINIAAMTHVAAR